MADLVGLEPCDILTFEVDLTACGLEVITDKVEHGGFPRTIGPDKTKDLSLFDLKAYVVDCR